MHPTSLDVAYMSRLIEKAAGYEFDGFEICGPCHGLDSGMDGVIDYQPYPRANKKIDLGKVDAARDKLKTIVDLAHSIGKPVIYWHREVIVPPDILIDEPNLLDENGEFDLLGDCFEKLILYKINAFFDAVPEIDGLVLTLTEADYSVIHNSNTASYPPQKVVEKIVRIFASEVQRRQKTFVLRSFGSIAQDYEDIIAGAAMAAKDYSFEIETKITPYDFVPFLPENPFLSKVDNCSLSAECDSIGEFLGAGFLPAANVENIVRYVREGKAAGVDYFAVRLDRVGNSIFDTHEINLFAYHQAIGNNLSTDEIWREWAKLRWPDCQSEMIKLGKNSYDFITRTNYIDGNVIFHKFPPDENIAWLKLGGIFALFSNGKPLKELSGIWSIMADRNTPGRAALLAEKVAAICIAEDSLKLLNSIKDRLPPREFEMAFRLWNNAVFVAKALHLFCQAACGYFDAMEVRASNINDLIEDSRNAFDKLAENAPCEALNIYIRPLLGMMLSLKDDFLMEAAERQRLADAYDLLVCGSLTDEWRTGRYQHGSKALVHNQRLGREIGNRVFPNGFISTFLVPPADAASLTLRIEAAANISSHFNLTVNGKKIVAELDEKGNYSLPLDKADQVKLVLEKSGDKYPVIHTIGIFP